jgi:hypothetical protein
MQDESSERAGQVPERPSVLVERIDESDYGVEVVVAVQLPGRSATELHVSDGMFGSGAEVWRESHCLWRESRERIFPTRYRRDLHDDPGDDAVGAAQVGAYDLDPGPDFVGSDGRPISHSSGPGRISIDYRAELDDGHGAPYRLTLEGPFGVVGDAVLTKSGAERLHFLLGAFLMDAGMTE